MSIDSYGIHLGPLYVHFYALFLISGIVVGAWLAARRARAQGLDPEHVWNGLMWAVLPGLIGARLYHILTPTPASGLSTAYYFQHPLEMLAIWNGGLGIYGAVVGGMLGIWLYTRSHKQPLFKWLDVAIPGLALAQAIGRWGNFVNQELYGAPSTLSWAIYIAPDKRLAGYQQFATYHPLFLYESLLNLLACALLIYIGRRFADRLRTGDLALLYLIMYPAIRFSLDFLRLDSAGITSSLTIAQGVSGVAIIAAFIVLIARHRTAAQPTTIQPVTVAEKKVDSVP